MQHAEARLSRTHWAALQPDLSLPQWVADSEGQQIQRKLSGWVDQLERLQVQDALQGLTALQRKPLRPLWISQATRLWTNEVADPADLPFTPLILVSASSVEHGRCIRASTVTGQAVESYDYVPGAGDDEESWAQGLTPALLHAHGQELLAAGPSGIRAAVAELIQRTKQDGLSGQPSTPGSISWIGDTGLGISCQNLVHHGNIWNTADVIVKCKVMALPRSKTAAAPPTVSQGGRHLSINILDVKTDRLGLKAQLPAIIAFAISHLIAGKRILVLDPSGSDCSVCVVAAVLQAGFLRRPHATTTSARLPAMQDATSEGCQHSSVVMQPAAFLHALLKDIQGRYQLRSPSRLLRPSPDPAQAWGIETSMAESSGTGASFEMPRPTALSDPTRPHTHTQDKSAWSSASRPVTGEVALLGTGGHAAHIELPAPQPSARTEAGEPAPATKPNPVAVSDGGLDWDALPTAPVADVHPPASPTLEGQPCKPPTAESPSAPPAQAIPSAEDAQLSAGHSRLQIVMVGSNSSACQPPAPSAAVQGPNAAVLPSTASDVPASAVSAAHTPNTQPGVKDSHTASLQVARSGAADDAPDHPAPAHVTLALDSAIPVPATESEVDLPAAEPGAKPVAVSEGGLDWDELAPAPDTVVPAPGDADSRDPSTQAAIETSPTLDHTPSMPVAVPAAHSTTHPQTEHVWESAAILGLRRSAAGARANQIAPENSLRIPSQASGPGSALLLAPLSGALPAPVVVPAGISPLSRRLPYEAESQHAAPAGLESGPLPTGMAPITSPTSAGPSLSWAPERPPRRATPSEHSLPAAVLQQPPVNQPVAQHNPA
ncbi:hypothetical protein WJX73_006400 [Symbiochloris irregularis]|uniref:Uncharacterized protein n=1 Tax=Symbiochloris irregularis TaxID=706552 RepID=A0AAW1PFB8_9CHLO